MLSVAFATLAAAVALGSALAIVYLRAGRAAAVPLALGILHGLLGLGGLGCLLFALRGPVRGIGQGTAAFGPIAATLLALAALVGLGILLMHRARKRYTGSLIGVHATLAISGFVVLAAYLMA